MRAATRGLLILAALAAVLLATAPDRAAAQDQDAACMKPVLDLQQPPASFEPGATETLAFLVENPNEEPVRSVEARISVHAPDGWQAIAGQSQITYTGPNSTPTSITVTAPSRGDGETQGTVNATVTFYCTVGSVATEPVQSSVTFDVRVEATKPSWLLISGLTFGALLVFTGVWAVRGRRGPVSVTTRERVKTMRPGRGASYPLVVLNRTGARDVVRFEVGGVPDGWIAHMALPQIELEAREERTLWLRVKPPEDVDANQEVRVTVHATSHRKPGEAATVTVRARVE